MTMMTFDLFGNLGLSRRHASGCLGFEKLPASDGRWKGIGNMIIGITQPPFQRGFSYCMIRSEMIRELISSKNRHNPGRNKNLMEINMKKHKSISIIILAGILTLALSACSDGSPSLPGGNKPQEVMSDLSQEDMTNFPLEDLADLAEGNSAFAVDLYQKLASQKGNLFYSPYSISSDLAMTYAGAEGKTAQEMAAVFHFLENEDQLHAGYNALSQYLESLA